MVTIERRVGRLVEIRARAGGESRPMFAKVIALANELGPDAKVIIIADVRQGATLNAAEQERLATAQLATRARVERAVTLVSGRPAQAMTAERVRDLGPGREVAHVARTAAEAIELLQPLLNAAELARLKQFLDGK